jgi:hypothetical protein
MNSTLAQTSMSTGYGLVDCLLTACLLLCRMQEVTEHNAAGGISATGFRLGLPQWQTQRLFARRRWQPLAQKGQPQDRV